MRIFTFLCILLISTTGYSHVFKLPVKVIANGEFKPYLILAEVVESSNEQIVKFEYFRAVSGEDVLQVIKTNFYGAEKWCNLLGFKYFNYSVVGFNPDYFYTNTQEHTGLYVASNGIFTIGTEKDDRDHDPHRLLSLSCTNNIIYKF